ncbi:MAG: agmatinase [Dehalococcoidia bacterium]
MTSDGLPVVPFTFLGLPTQSHTYEQASAVILPVPYDGTASFRSGAREGPEAIISASRELEDYDTELRCEPSSRGIHTAPALEPDLGSPQAMGARITQAVKPVAMAGKLPVVLGGDHSVTIGAVKALLAVHSDLSVLYLDAHADFRDEYLGTRLGHASVARRLAELCPVTLVGVRSMSLDEAKALDASDVRVVTTNPAEPGVSWDALVESLSGRVYVSIDLDVFDPSFMAAVGTPEPGGMEWYDVLRLLRRVAERRRIVGFDVVEMTPREGPSACAYIAAKLVYKLIGYSVALATEG